MKQWSCRDCAWTGTSGDHVVAVFHSCRPDGIRRRLVNLDDAEAASEASFAERAQWYLARWPKPAPLKDPR